MTGLCRVKAASGLSGSHSHLVSPGENMHGSHFLSRLASVSLSITLSLQIISMNERILLVDLFNVPSVFL